MKLLKFGGSSVADSERIKRVSNIIANYEKLGPVSAVVSAFGGITDLLINTALKAKERDESYLEEIEKIANRHINVIEEIIGLNERANTLLPITMLMKRNKKIPSRYFNAFICFSSYY